MNRRSFLTRLGIAGAAAPLAPLAMIEQKVDPILRALLEKGARIVERPEWGADSLWRAEVWLGENIVGYIAKANGALQLCTRVWPRR